MLKKKKNDPYPDTKLTRYTPVHGEVVEKQWKF